MPVDAGLPVLEPDLVLATLQRWKTSGRLTGEQFAFPARNALSNRLKQGWPPAYAGLGCAHDAPITLPLALERTELRDDDIPELLRRSHRLPPLRSRSTALEAAAIARCGTVRAVRNPPKE
ncbi:hypothetical protein [Streptomyces sp. 35G-GA-8]|uniref:hypothetical protein n=1 Tax=Streptomyces sp. 35G-GA-8 TaxID=2939434 RepID=UPI00201F5F99|nr:hypothetical protein [Streptomyces sp. 35G-GA-8]MCL7378361.1 hypothetical protein [Streptomyces sp. 35G-GA-8]